MYTLNTTLSKTVKVMAWVLLSAAAAIVLTALPGLDLNDLGWLTPGINVVLVFLKNLADKNVDNF